MCGWICDNNGNIFNINYYIIYTDFWVCTSHTVAFWCRSISVSALVRVWEIFQYTLFLCLLGIRVLVDAREKLYIPWGKPSNQQHGDTMMAFDTRSVMAQGHGMVEQKVFQHYLPSIKALWADEGIQNAYDRRREFQLVSFSFSPTSSSLMALCSNALPVILMVVFEHPFFFLTGKLWLLFKFEQSPLPQNSPF